MDRTRARVNIESMRTLRSSYSMQYITNLSMYKRESIMPAFKKIKDALVGNGLEKVSDKVLDVGRIYALVQLA